ncbi:hypothetical protein [Crocosphaera chwakensis]|uniref:D-fructose-6-phosphate amidotransferase n=1 Tax=Crocosphaera chwakensis CCY0110 TaxID=391612 RepID=A3IP14_9CHRO|nr:hypothetical protein [Crocosphaera chwakensis]EAZ91816.1 D-fructose-6-phosphate amidotransferase [Crocosphaera chwakensis CCY0110]
MGPSFTNIIVKGQTQDILVNYLKQLNRIAYVSPTENDYTVVYDQKSEQDLKQLSDLANQISKDLTCLAFAILIYDESVFCYELYEQGKLLDEYNSNPDIHDNNYNLNNLAFPEGGDAEKICNKLGVKSMIDKVRPILREPNNSEFYLLASTRHKRLVKVLGIPIFWSTDFVGGYRYIDYLNLVLI